MTGTVPAASSARPEARPKPAASAAVTRSLRRVIIRGAPASSRGCCARLLVVGRQVRRVRGRRVAFKVCDQLLHLAYLADLGLDDAVGQLAHAWVPDMGAFAGQQGNRVVGYQGLHI